jgi:hypothetical protein
VAHAHRQNPGGIRITVFFYAYGKAAGLIQTRP